MNYSADEQLFPSNYGYSTLEIIYVELFKFPSYSWNFYLLDVKAFACVFIEDCKKPGVPEDL